MLLRAIGAVWLALGAGVVMAATENPTIPPTGLATPGGGASVLRDVVHPPAQGGSCSTRADMMSPGVGREDAILVFPPGDGTAREAVPLPPWSVMLASVAMLALMARASRSRPRPIGG